jgi:MEMO1 family protein
MSNHKYYSAVLGLALGLFIVTGALGQETLLKVRKPVFAGSFYPRDPAALERMVESSLKDASAKGDPVAAGIFGLVAPHAGYEYSGKVAGYAYSQIKGKPYSTVIIIGPSHQIPFRGVSVYPSGQWETPLGNVAVDSETARLLMEKCKSVKPFSPAFEKEHSLEVQLPFLQKTLKDFRIVPLVTGDMGADDFKSLSEALASLVRQNPKTFLIVASSDMSHYHNYSLAVKMDGGTLKNIEKLDVDKVLEGVRSGEGELCGAQAVITLMMVAKRMNGDVKLLNYANSGDVTRDRSRVVGYGSLAFFTPGEEGSALNLNERNTLLTLARRTLDDYITKKSVPRIEVTEKRLLEKRGAFVTLTKDGQLRGCIGYVMPVAPLHKAVSEMAVNASTKDPRFPAVSKGELKDIHIEISVLSPLQPVTRIEEIEMGRHGLYIMKGNYAGLLLPQVATEYKWNREEFLQQTCRKAGLPPTAWKEKGVQLYMFSAQIFSE